MQSINCLKCGKIFTYLGAGPKICIDCKNKEEQLFQDVKEYIYNNDDCTIKDVAEHFKIKPQLINSWIASERLELKKTSAITVTCEVCGEPITTGKLCSKCKAQAINDLSGLVNKQNKQLIQPTKKTIGQAKMQFLKK